MKILLVTAEPAGFSSFTDALLHTNGVKIFQASSGREALEMAREIHPHLAVIDQDPPDGAALKLVADLLKIDAMINTAVVSGVSEEEFHEISEGLGVMCSLPPNPGPGEARKVLATLRALTGL